MSLSFSSSLPYLPPFLVPQSDSPYILISLFLSLQFFFFYILGDVKEKGTFRRARTLSICIKGLCFLSFGTNKLKTSKKQTKMFPFSCSLRTLFLLPERSLGPVCTFQYVKAKNQTLYRVMILAMFSPSSGKHRG